MKPPLSLVLLILAAAGLLSAQSTESALASSGRMEQNVAIAMRDGVRLRADVFLPVGEGRFPVLVYRTPYGKDNALKEYMTFRHAVERGYAVVVQDVRGRYASEGEFRPYENEGRDGFDTIEWAAQQPWSNGNVGTFGLSYPGAVQWLAAVENPPHLRAMVPAMTFSTPQNFFYAWGTWDLSWIEWIWDNIAFDVRGKKNLPGPKTYEESLAAWPKVGPVMEDTVPLRSLAELKNVAPYYYDWLSHPPDDPWWNWCELRNKYDHVQAAVLNLSAWYDDNYGPDGATTNFAGLLKSRATNAARTGLLLGPWVHGVDSTAKTKSGERELGPAAAIDYDEVVLRWMDHYLRGIDNGIEKASPVRYFVMGENQWHDAAAWPPPAHATSYYLSGLKEGRTGSLSLESPKAQGQFTAFVSDPNDPVRNRYDSSGAHDYRDLAKRADVLTFDSVEVMTDTEVTGPIRARIFLSCDCRDLDVWVRLLDVSPDGTAFNLMSPGLDVQRASYRDVSKGRQLLTPDRIYEIDLDHLMTGNVFLRGHKIRVQLSASFFPNFSRNLQSGESEGDSSKAQKATIRIYHDAGHPSQLILPVIPR
jgi:putative CocE/NonD family hydrolase